MNHQPTADGKRTRPVVTRDKGVTRDKIVAAALQLIESRGFTALSMRNVASAVGVYPATVYWHVGNKSRLLGLVCERVLSQIDLPADELPWTEWMLRFGTSARKVIGAHPRFAAYFVTSIQTSDASLSIADRMFGVLGDAGFQRAELVPTYNALMGAIFGWISGEFATLPDGYDGGERDSIESRLNEGARTGLFGHLRKNWPILSNRAFLLRWDPGTVSPMTSSFELMLTSLIEGLERRRTSSQPTAAR